MTLAYEQKPGDISIFAETDKRNDRAPDWKGSMVVPDGAKPGDKMEVAMWIKGDRGTMLAGSVKPPRQRESGDDDFRGSGSGDVAGDNRHGRGQDAGRKAAYEADMNSDIPF